MTVRKQMSEFRKLSEEGKESYKAFFANMLKKFGVNSPAELSDDKKKEFFAAVNSGWKSTTEQMAIKAAGATAKVVRRFGHTAKKTAKGGFGMIKGKVSKGGFGSIAGRLEQDDIEDEDDEEVSEGIKDKYLAMRCKNINKDISSFTGYKSKVRNKYSNNPEKAEKIISAMEDSLSGLKLQKKKWGC